MQYELLLAQNLRFLKNTKHITIFHSPGALNINFNIGETLKMIKSIKKVDKL